VRKFLIIGVALLAAAVAALAIYRQRADREAPVRAHSRPAQAPSRAAEPRLDSQGFVGVIFARQQVDLTSSAEAVVRTIPVQLGSHVSRGSVIATLDADAVRRELAAANAAVRAANAELAEVRVELAAAAEKVRRQARFPEGISGEEIAQAITRERTLTSQVAAARARVGGAAARVDQLRLLVENAAIEAPFDGVIAARFVDPGALVGPGKPIARLISAGDLWIRFAVPEELAGTVAVRSCVRVVMHSPEVAVLGLVEMVAPQVDTALRMLIAEARLTVPPQWRGKLQAGLSAEVNPAPCGPS